MTDAAWKSNAASVLRAAVLLLALAFGVLGTAGQVRAVQPDEILDDPALESRAREISAGLRCLVCQNESIDESNASLARDLRLLVRERLMEGDSNEEVVDYIVERYGEFVLLKPTTGGWNWLLWAAGPILFALALILAGLYIRGRSRAAAPAEEGLTEAERRRLSEILDE
ncbi:cytochrome c-type biogenesis protein [Salipiger mucosus]|uniref:Cytochrome c-type biogenesis protein n=1 Tax=Salipiger mucosus DSM 16094 TaxID=1123237 RepID=S9QFI4_9RHOB|nr:cytochrome c-type biogenesis protein [Salipiger mucosus]EPX78378.1 Cytochrome c heme lyase subunit CcmL [Salipiger mucosus DSM 16094]